MYNDDMTINQWLDDVANRLADEMIPTARLDAEIILAHTLGKPRTWLHSHGDETLDQRRRDIADARVTLRLERVPVAYIIGHKEFYGRRFHVSPSVLIPRPESEALIELLNAWLKTHQAKHLIDVGTGSGCLGITAKLEHPDISVTLADKDADALKIAGKNVAEHGVEARLLKSDLLDAYPIRPDVIIANLPYVDPDWIVSEDARHEPSQALYADDGGQKLIKELIDHTESQLNAGGAIILEADPRQHDAIIAYGDSHGLNFVEARDFGLLLAN